MEDTAQGTPTARPPQRRATRTNAAKNQKHARSHPEPRALKRRTRRRLSPHARTRAKIENTTRQTPEAMQQHRTPTRTLSTDEPTRRRTSLKSFRARKGSMREKNKKRDMQNENTTVKKAIRRRGGGKDNKCCARARCGRQLCSGPIV